MKSFKRYFIHVLEILVILILIAGVIYGLERIGIFSFSELLPWVDSEISDGHNDHFKYDNDIYSALAEQKSSDKVSVVSDLSREHVIKLLEEITVSENYYQEYNVSIPDNIGVSFDSKATVLCRDGLYDVSLYSNSGNIYKRVVESENTVEIYNFDSAGKESKTTLNKGGFDIQSDTGIIMTHNRFFSDYASYDPESEFYSVAYSDFGSVLYFEFLTEIDEFSQKECYWLSLDYGVVIKAECFEDENLVYSLETMTINNDF
jgi:hypothetical protein